MLVKLGEHAGSSTAVLVRAAESMTAAMIAELKGDMLSLPELVKEYLNFGAKLVEVALSDVVYSNVMPTMLEMAMGVLSCDNGDLINTAAGFMQGALQHGANAPPPAAVAQGAGAAGANCVVTWLGTGEKLTAQLMQAMIVTCPQTEVDLIAELLKSMALLLGPQAFQIIGALVTNPAFPAPHVAMDTRVKFVQTLQQTVESTYKFTFACTDFSTLCRTRK